MLTTYYSWLSMHNISPYIYVIIGTFFENYMEHSLLVLFKETHSSFQPICKKLCKGVCQWTKELRVKDEPEAFNV